MYTHLCICIYIYMHKRPDGHHVWPAPRFVNQQVKFLFGGTSYHALRQLDQEQWLQRHPEAGSSWASWPKVSCVVRRDGRSSKTAAP